MARPPVGAGKQVYLCRNCIGGDWRASGGKTKLLADPATGEAITEIPESAPQKIHEAIAAAQSAFDSWRRQPVTERAKILFRYRELLCSHSIEFYAEKKLSTSRWSN